MLDDSAVSSFRPRAFTSSLVLGKVREYDSEFQGPEHAKFLCERPGRYIPKTRLFRPRKLTLLDRTQALQDLAAMLSDRLETLRVDLAGEHSIRINVQWYIYSRWIYDVPCVAEIVNYR